VQGIHIQHNQVNRHLFRQAVAQCIQAVERVNDLPRQLGGCNTPGDLRIVANHKHGWHGPPLVPGRWPGALQWLQLHGNALFLLPALLDVAVDFC